MALGRIGLYIFPIEKTSYVTKNNTKINQQVSKYIQDTIIYKIPGGGQAAAARGGPPGRRLVFCISFMYLYIFGYILVYFG